MLANLDNEVHFKKVFTDVDVFCAFVKDVLGIEMKILKVETEKVLPSKTSAIKFRMDLFAEDKENRTVVEIQKVDYDYTYDRFTHYFTGNLSDVQRSSKTYTYGKDIYIIVVVTSAYRITDKHGVLLKDDVLITDMNPRTLDGQVRDMYNHKLVILNSTNVTAATPPAILDWLNLITESIKNPENPRINKSKPAIVRAAELAEADNIDPEEIADAKIEEMRKETLARVEIDAGKKVKAAQDEAKAAQDEAKAAQDEAKAAQDEAKAAQDEAKAAQDEAKAAQDKLKVAQDKIQDDQKERIVNLVKIGKLSVADIVNVFGVTSEYVEQIKAEIA
ncbi:MAG: PD-(D/E)XK nuclease family transposase [Saprospiraceae bacterium]|nr:PD-(D/E)XK nuclease family transposase [Saprospiraceae bacterium]